MRNNWVRLCAISTYFYDFNKSHWVLLHGQSASLSLLEGLELYGLLDMDASGEEAVNWEIDHLLV